MMIYIEFHLMNLTILPFTALIETLIKNICGSNFEMHFVDAIWRCAF